MHGVRQRLTLYYLVALTCSLLVFGALLYVERQTNAAREREEQLNERLLAEGALIRRVIEETGRSLPRVVLVQPALGRGVDSTYELVADVRRFFDGLRDFLFVMDPGGRLLYVSLEGRSLDPASLTLVKRTMLRQPVTPREGRLQLGTATDVYRFRIDTIGGATAGQVRSFLVAARPESPPAGPDQLLLSMIVVAPIILGASAVLGYWMAGRVLEPVDQIVAEVEAIQDGRSLHRRLGVPLGNDEFARLAATLNAMLGRVERSFLALRRFTADASHELKTPLMVLRAGVERSLTHPGAPDEVVDALDETLRQINGMTEMVTNLLTLARADEGRSSLVVADVDLVPLVSEAGETAEILGERQGVAVAVTLPTVPLVASVEAGRIRQLLLNLVTNAVKYTPPGGEVELRLAAETDRAIIVVRDTGIGIATGDLEHIFERFWRADPARARTGDRPGTGLGLAIVEWIVDAHAGTIDVQSRPGRGSTFTVTLPLREESAA
jgi:signal transduction histidine kinase